MQDLGAKEFDINPAIEKIVGTRLNILEIRQNTIKRNNFEH